MVNSKKSSTFAPAFVSSMKKPNEIVLDLGTLTMGQHVLEFTLDNAFFAGLDQDEILGGQCKATVEINAREQSTSLRIGITGTVQVTCDRCLDPMDVDLEPVEDSVLLKLAPEAGEDDEAIYVAENKPEFDLGWLLYELIAVRLPVVHSHADGMCNPEMAALLEKLEVDESKE